MLPNFLILGANKAGTSSLHSYLAQHPDIFMSEPKEPMFFAHLAGGVRPENGNDALGASIDNWDAYRRLFEDANGPRHPSSRLQ